MRLAMIAVLAMACHGGERAPARVAPRPTPPQREVVDQAAPGPAFTGRVLSYSTPVAHFGVFVGKRYVLDFDAKAFVEVHAADGRFRIPVPPGTWDIVIVGPEFAREMLVDRALEATDNDLGDIAVKPGNTVQGRVLDVAGRPVQGAVVTIGDRVIQGGSDPFRERANGRFLTTTDRAGSYVIRGVASSDPFDLRPELQIVARTPTTLSWPTDVPPTNVTIDLVARPTGRLEVVGDGVKPGTLVNVESTQPKARYYPRFDNHRFAIDLPGGDYVVTVFHGRFGHRQKAKVVAGSTVTLTVP